MTLPLTNRSEVATFLSQIDAEYHSAHTALHGLSAGTTRHDFISARMEYIRAASQRLIDTIGKEEALPLIIAAIDHFTS